MSAEILKGYRLRKGNRQRLIESVFALWKFSWLENGQLLAKKRKDHYLFLLSFLSEPEAERHRHAVHSRTGELGLCFPR